MAGRALYQPNSPQFRQLNPQLGGATPERAFGEAIPQQAGDYDEIMQGYRSMMGGGSDPYAGLLSRYKAELEGGGNKFSPVSYTEAPEFQQAFAKATELANSGGLSEGEQGSLRARAISPIRSVYANMQRNMDRQKSLGGGFSPNYNAVASRMAREGSEQIAGTTTNANAAIAEMVQKGRLAMAPEMAKLAAGKNELMNQVLLGNQSNQAKYNDSRAGLLQGMNQAISGQQGRTADALRGMTSLYGTTPALVNTYGNITQNQQQIGNQSAQANAANRTNRQRLALGINRGGGY